MHSTESTALPTPTPPYPIVWAAPVADPAPRGLCTDCGISRTSEPKRCGQACQFIQPDYPKLEAQVHGRVRKTASESVTDGDGASDEPWFGPYRRMLQASLVPARSGAQWSGITTRIAERLLETGAVDAVLAMAPDPNDSWRPMPVLVTSAEGMAQCRGMRMGYAPLLALLEPARTRGFKRLAVIGIPCQVYALRALEKEFGFERLYVIGTPCSDNTTTENFHQFLELVATQLKLRAQDITYLEFRADYRVELRFTDGRVKLIPFLQLPLSTLPPDFFPLTCRTCVDYTNVLADITVGYMAGQGEQWLLVRNDRGEELVALLGDELQTQPVGTAGKRHGAVKGFLANVQLAAGGLPLRRMPNWLRPIVGWLMPRIGPRGVEFAKARVEMKAAETVVHLRREYPSRIKNMVPGHVWPLVAPYGLTPGADELPAVGHVPASATETRG